MLTWLRKLLRGPADQPAAVPQVDMSRADLLAEMEQHITRLVTAGYETPQQILGSVTDYMGDDLDARTIDLEGGPMLARALADHAAAQQDWPAVTDYDRLTRAFAALEDRGVVARENFSCCGNCGSAEIWDEIDAERDSGRTIVGYTFFHMQDTERAAEGDGLYLNYGAVAEGESAAIEVANAVVEALTVNGLAVTWDGTWDQRIGVAIDWRRRRPSGGAPPSRMLH